MANKNKSEGGPQFGIFRVGYLRVPHLGRHKKNTIPVDLPDWYREVDGERHRNHVPEKVVASAVTLGLLIAGLIYFAR